MNKIVFIFAFIYLNIATMESQNLDSAILGGGCFWCLEAVFQNLKGVEKVESGYCGGETEFPTYQEVCTGTTKHAEVVRITFDSKEISYEQLLSVFFATHDPTTLNRQGNDVGTQYRSVIFYKNEEQKNIAEKIIKQLNDDEVFINPIVTEISAEQTFYNAELIHKDYYISNKTQPYCQYVIAPKVLKFKHEFGELLKK